MPICLMTSAVLSGSNSGGLVPDPHCSVPESEDIEILATHVSHPYFVWVCFISLKSSAPQDSEEFNWKQPSYSFNVSDQQIQKQLCLYYTIAYGL